MQDHTERFMKGPVYKPFTDKLLSLLSRENPIVSVNHYNFTASPASLPTEHEPTLEVFAISFSPPSEVDRVTAAMQPITQHWKDIGKNWTTAVALDDDPPRKLMYIAGWKSREAHFEAKKDPHFQAAIVEAKKLWKNVELFGHITP